MQQLPEQEQEQRRLIELAKRAVLLHSDEEVLGMIESPKPPCMPGIMAAIIAAIGRNGLVLRALERGVLSPDTPCEAGTVVHIAALYGPLELLKSLIMERGVDPNEASTEGWRPLSIAIYGGRVQEAFFLINEAPGVDIEAPLPSGDTPFMLAAERGMVDVLRALVAKGANVNAKNELGYSALHTIIRERQRAAALYLINEAPGVDIDALGGHKITPSVMAAGYGDVAVMRALVAKGVDVNASGEAGVTPLHMAISQGQEAAALYLVEEAAVVVYDPDAPVQAPALTMAAGDSLFRVVRAIVRRMRADSVDSAAVAAEMGAAARCAIEKKLESLIALVEEGLDVDQAPPVATGNGKSFAHPLFHHACIKRNREAAALLVERGCDPLARNGRGARAHHELAAQGNRLPMLQWLMASFPTPVDDLVTEPDDVSGPTMLHFAAGEGRLETVQWLVGEGANVLCTAHVSGEDAKRSSQVAEREGHATVAAYLREKEAEVLEAAARRARNEKRRQKQKKAKARRRAAAEHGGAGADRSGDEGEDGDGAASVEGAAGEASGGVGGGGSDREQEEGAGEQQQQQPKQEAEEEEEQGQEEEDDDEDVDPELLAAAIALSLAPPDEEDEKEEEEQQPQQQLPPPPPLEEFLEARTPEWLLCPITVHLLDDPVLLVADGCTYSRAAIEEHLAFCRQKGKPLTSPSTNLEIDPAMAILAPNVLARGKVLEFKAATTREWEALQREWEQATGAGRGW